MSDCSGTLTCGDIEIGFYRHDGRLVLFTNQRGVCIDRHYVALPPELGREGLMTDAEFDRFLARNRRELSGR